MPEKINGTWFEFIHHTGCEGKYWDSACRGFTSAQWEQKVDEIASLGMKYIVLMNTASCSSDGGECFFETDIFPFADIACTDPIEALLTAADRNDLRVFVSCGFYGNRLRPARNMSSAEVTERAFKAMDELWVRYGKHTSFYGWYFPDETCVWGHFSRKFIDYVNRYSAKAHEIAPNTKTLIAPYGTKIIRADKKYIRQLKKLDVDIIAYQDEVGVKKSTPAQTAKYFRRLRRAHDAPGTPALWADMEIFTFEKIVYRSALIPAPAERIRQQLASVAPYVDEVLCYQYQGMVNMPGTDAFCGHPESENLYREIKTINCKKM